MAKRALDRLGGFGGSHERAALACDIPWSLGEEPNKRISIMSSLIFVSPLAVSAMISLWLGLKMRLIVFAAWLAICVTVAILLMVTAFGDGTLSGTGLMLLATLMLFQCSAFMLGVLVARARANRNDE